METHELTDEQLLAAYHNGDMAAFECLYERHRQPMYLYLLGQGLNQNNSEELFHEAWLKVLKQSDFTHDNFKAWLYTVLRHMSIDLLRKNTLRNADEYDENFHAQTTQVSAQKQNEDDDCINLMNHSIAQLPRDQRDAFLLQHEAGLSLKQIADVMSVGHETIKSRLRYAMNSLKSWLEDCL